MKYGYLLAPIPPLAEEGLNIVEDNIISPDDQWNGSMSPHVRQLALPGE
jgi:hypothetical protein